MLFSIEGRFVSKAEINEAEFRRVVIKC